MRIITCGPNHIFAVVFLLFMGLIAAPAVPVLFHVPASGEAGSEEFVTITLGPVLDADDMPISGATVTLTLDGEAYTGSTDSAGNANLTLPVSALGREVRVSIDMDGYDTREFNVRLDSEGVLEGVPQILGMAAAGEEEGEEFPMYAIYVLLGLGGVAAIMVLVLTRYYGRVQEEVRGPEDGDKKEDHGK